MYILCKFKKLFSYLQVFLKKQRILKTVLVVDILLRKNLRSNSFFTIVICGPDWIRTNILL